MEEEYTAKEKGKNKIDIETKKSNIGANNVKKTKTPSGGKKSIGKIISDENEKPIIEFSGDTVWYYNTTEDNCNLRSGTNAIKIDKSFSRLSSPAKFEITLLPHQKAIVYAMLELENNGYTLFTDGNTPRDRSKLFRVETTAGLLSDKPGSGKTFEILALIYFKKIPPIRDEIAPIFTNITYSAGRYKQNARLSAWYETTAIIRRKYRKFLPCNFVFVSKSVLTQWKSAIRQTSLKFFSIDNITSLWDFYNHLFKPTETKNANTLSNYDIILIKNSKVSKSFNPPEIKEYYPGGYSDLSIAVALNILLKDVRIARYIVDDFDMIRFSRDTYCIPALFTWFVSATRKLPNIAGENEFINDISKEIIQKQTPCNLAWWDNNIMESCRNQCSDDFINYSMDASMVTFISYIFKNPNEVYLGLLNAIGNSASSILEALNGDAIREANRAAGINNIKGKVSNIFEKILNENWDNWKHNFNIEKYINQKITPYMALLKNKKLERKKNNKSDDESDDEKNAAESSSSYENKIVHNLKVPGPFNEFKQIVKRESEVVIKTITEVKKNNEREKEENGKIINRVRDNLKEGSCPIMCTLLRDSKIVILNCCGQAISWEGAQISMKLQNNNGEGSGICPNCRSKINKNNLIFIDRDVDIDNIIKEKLDDEKEEEKNEPEKEKFDKYECILSLICPKKYEKWGNNLKTCSNIMNFEMPEIASSKKPKGSAAIGDRKFIVYCGFSETLEKIIEKLDGEKIRYKTLRGSAPIINNIVNKFWLNNRDEEAYEVILLKGPEFCAGLNLQCATDVIFTHKTDKNVETQVIGRAARIGRLSDLNVHYVLYENEYTKF